MYLGEPSEVHTTLGVEKCAYMCDNATDFTCRLVVIHSFSFLFSFPDFLSLVMFSFFIVSLKCFLFRSLNIYYDILTFSVHIIFVCNHPHVPDPLSPFLPLLLVCKLHCHRISWCHVLNLFNLVILLPTFGTQWCNGSTFTSQPRGPGFNYQMEWRWVGSLL